MAWSQSLKHISIFKKENPLVLPLVLLKLFLDYLETRQQITTAALESPF
jgi:hypothetical protein